MNMAIINRCSLIRAVATDGVLTSTDVKLAVRELHPEYRIRTVHNSQVILISSSGGALAGQRTCDLQVAGSSPVGWLGTLA